MVLNTATYETTRYSPFFLLQPRPPRYTLDPIRTFSIIDHICIAETVSVAEEACRIERLGSIAFPRALESTLRRARPALHLFFGIYGLALPIGQEPWVAPKANDRLRWLYVVVT